jgi:hypothetical protein
MAKRLGPKHFIISLLKKNSIFKISLLWLLAMVASHSLSAAHIKKNKVFRIVKTNERTFYPGVQGSPINTKVVLTLKMRKTTTLNADSFWMDDRSDKVEMYNTSWEPITGAVRKGDTVLIVCSLYLSTYDATLTPPNDRFEGSPVTPRPMQCIGRLLFRWRNGEAWNYACIPKTEKEESVYAP